MLWPWAVGMKDNKEDLLGSKGVLTTPGISGECAHGDEDTNRASQAAKISLETLRMSVKCAYGEEGSFNGSREGSRAPWAVGNMGMKEYKEGVSGSKNIIKNS